MLDRGEQLLHGHLGTKARPAVRGDVLVERHLGQAPEPRPDADRGPPFEQQRAGVGEQQHAQRAARQRLRRPRRGQRVDPAVAPGDAIGRHRAALARGPGARADRGAEIHQPLRVGLDVAPGHERLGVAPQRRRDLGLAGEARDAAVAREHALDVAVEDRGAPAEREDGDRRRGRATDSRECREAVDILRKGAAVSLHDRPGRGVQMVRAAVIAEPAPESQHVVERCRGQSGDIGKTVEETPVVRQRRRDLRLLQHDLRQPDPVRVARVLPGEVPAAVHSLPRDEARGERPGHRVRRCE